MRNVLKVVVKAKSTAAKDGFMLPLALDNCFVELADRTAKLEYLVNFLMVHRDKKVLVFFNTCAAVTFYERAFREVTQLRQLQIRAIHGKLKQTRRARVVEEFVRAEKGILFGTDVVARGIDFQAVHTILQVDPPSDPHSFIHRIGRTARVGREGSAIILLEPEEMGFI
jgi:ATP-dependent RNA helicase DDX55/SPB4